jgi:peptide/nickel transport system permease protein
VTGDLIRYALYIGTKIALAALTSFGVTTLVFFGMRAIPGSYADLFFPLLSAQERVSIGHQLGLDASPVEQYIRWLLRIAHGDFGISVATGKPVLDEIFTRLPLTVELGGLALLIIIFVGMPFGIMAGMFPTSLVSRSGRLGGTFLMSLPDFVFGSVLLYLFSRSSLWFSAGGWVAPDKGIVENLRHAVLPALALSTTGLGLILSTTRGSVLTVLGQDHILAAVARGLRPEMIFSRHVLRNALIPIVTLLAIIAGYLLGGAVIVENVFNLNGVGRLLVNSIGNRDYPVVQAGVILTSSIFVLLNTLADIAYGFIDPRVLRRGNG